MMSKKVATFNYELLLAAVKSRIQQGQTAAVLAVNVQLSQLYWEIGAMIAERQNLEGYGTAVIPRLSKDIANELPEIKGFSERNIGRMIAFFRAYPSPAEVLPQPVAKVKTADNAKEHEDLPQLVAHATDSIIWLIPWGHHALLIEKIKDFPDRVWYM
jgi:hypothetical protein